MRVMEIRKIKTKTIPIGKTSSPSTPCLTSGAFAHLIWLKKHRSIVKAPIKVNICLIYISLFRLTPHYRKGAELKEENLKCLVIAG